MLQITEHTVKAHVKSLLLKLGASGRTEAIAIAIKRGLIGKDQNVGNTCGD